MPRRLLILLAIPLLFLASKTATVPATQSKSSPSALKKVTFSFTPDRAYQNVFLAGTFNGWSTDATSMRIKGDHYEVTLFLSKGDYQYKFVADGNWITDYNAKKFHPDGYGGQNSVVTVDDSFPDVAMARGDGEIMTEGLRHREDAWERGLAPDGTVTLRVRTWMDDVEHVDLCWNPATNDPAVSVSWRQYACTAMELVDKDGTYDYYEAHLTESIFTYFFTLKDGEATMVLDRQGARPAPAGNLNLFYFNASEIAAFATPDWVKEGIIYQIFPERFANGDKSNDPDFSEWYYEGLTTLPPSGKTNGEYFHMVDDWYDVAGLTKSPYKTDGKPDWNSFYGGDIAGTRQNLDYLEDLGITAIYFNPVFQAKSNHKYDAATYTEIDPHFGTNEEFADFVADCHGRGIRVIIDLAFNHTGHTFWAFVDAREKGTDSQYWNWYEFKQWPIPGSRVWTPPNASDYYDCWWNFGQMPNLNFDLARANPEEQKVADISEAQPNWPLVNHLLDAAQFWLEQTDIDGYRLDVASDVPFWFWELFRKRVKETKPDAYIVGELWGASPEWVNGRYFDAVMNYKFFRDPVLAFLAKGEMSAQEFDRSIAPGRMIYPPEGVEAQMNLLGSHDTERFLTTAGGNIRRIRLAMLFAMTYVGAPTIYYGDEIAMTGGGDPDCRRPFLWNWQDDSERTSLHAYIRKLASLRKQHACLTRGTFETLVADDKAYAYLRAAGQDQAVVAINAGPDDISLEVPLPDGTTGATDALTGQPVSVDSHETGPTVTVTLAPLSGTFFLLVAPDG